MAAPDQYRVVQCHDASTTAEQPIPTPCLRSLPVRGQAWEFDVPLRVVALRGSVPAQWAADFRTAAGARAHLKLQQRPQLQIIYDELSNVRRGWRTHACGAHMQMFAATAIRPWDAYMVGPAGRLFFAEVTRIAVQLTMTTWRPGRRTRRPLLTR